MFRVKKSAFGIFCFCLSLAFISCASGSKTGSRNAEPGWIRDPYSKYDKQTNVAAVGSGSNRQAAEKNALGNLVAIFGQAIYVDEKVSTLYKEAVSKGIAAEWSDFTAIDNTVATSAGLDSLVGAEIGDAWNNGGNEYYAVAVLNKTKAIQIYSNMIRSNQVMINNLINLSDTDKYSLEGYSRYQLAATVADINYGYGNLLSVIGSPALAMGLGKGDDYRFEAVSIARAIPLNLVVQNDPSGRIQGAFSKILSGMGFQSGSGNSRYLLDIKVNSTPVDLPNNQNKFTRIEVSADLIDEYSATVLLPYNFNIREGHLTQSEADNRAFTAAERKINSEYANILNGYLSQLLPRK